MRINRAPAARPTMQATLANRATMPSRSRHLLIALVFAAALWATLLALVSLLTLD